MITIRAFGPPVLEMAEGSAPAELLWRKHLALLVHLARSQPQGRSRAHLAALLWGDRADAAARGSLNEATRLIRKHLGDGAVESTADRIRLAPGVFDLDLDRFREWTETGDWDSAARLVRGEFLEDFEIAGA
ncbi:MAG TPA: hypothetical protein VFL95_02230, partial [Gemmatimonadales bacterium]|nr:hypothetical protein [Gemmatimonadales bacterium]